MLTLTFWLKSTFLLLLFSMLSILSFAQERHITGNLTSVEGAPLQGISVIARDSGQSTRSDIDGNFSIIVHGPKSVLVFSSVGYITEAILVGNQTVIDLVLRPDEALLDQMVVTGYAIRQKRDITGAISVVDVEKLNQMPQDNVSQQLQGRVAGVTVTQDSRPGKAAKVRIRGFGSFRNNNPLYIVDGVPTMNVNALNPYDIESMSVL